MTPKADLNMRVKCAWSAKPAANANSANGIPPGSRFLAKSSRRMRHAISLPETWRLVEMTLEQARAFVAFSVAAAGRPGPSNVLLTATGAHVGVLRGLPCLLGIALGMALLMFIVAFGLDSVILTNPLVLKGVKWCGAVVLCWLAWKIATARRVTAAPGDKPVGLSARRPFNGSTRSG